MSALFGVKGSKQYDFLPLICSTHIDNGSQNVYNAIHNQGRTIDCINILEYVYINPKYIQMHTNDVAGASVSVQ